MKAIVYTAPGQFEYRDVECPAIKDDEILIKVKACGLCRTDMHIHKGHFISEFPLINGDEFVGTVAEKGNDVNTLEIGDRVAADNTELCGHCDYCRKNQPLFCENFVSHGCNCAGGFAEYVAVKAEKAFKIATLSYNHAVMIEPTACAIHGMDVIGVKPGSDVLLFGAGPTGIIMAQLLKHNGAARLVVAAPAGKKLELAAKLAADEGVPVDKNDYAVHGKHITEQYPNGFDTVIDATGVPQLFKEGIKYVKKGGQLIAYGVYPESADVSINPYEIFSRELTIKGSFAQTHCFDRALRYLESGKVRVDEMVTHTLPLKDYGEALKLMDEDKSVLKIALVP